MPGDVVTFTATVINQGAGPVVDLSTITLGLDETLLATKAIDTILLVGESIEITGDWLYAEGSHSLSVTADPDNLIAETDETNNSLSLTVTAVVDQESPQFISSMPVDNSYVNAVSYLSITLEDIHGNLDATVTLATLGLKNSNNQQVAGAGSMLNSDIFIFTPDTPLPDGSYTAEIVAQDSAGNSSQYQFQFTLDSVPPAPPIITGGIVASGVIQARPMANRANTLEVILTGTGEPESTLYVNGVTGTVVTDLQDWATSISLQPAINSLGVYLVDRAGNMSAKTWVDIMVETEFPLVIEYGETGRIERVYIP